MSYRRTGIVYSLDEEGIARIIFNDKRDGFEGVFTADDGDCVTLLGKLVARGDTPSTSTMDVLAVDSETGAQFQNPPPTKCLSGTSLAHDVFVEFYKNPNPIGSHPYVSLKGENINFSTLAVFHGMRADVEIQKYMNPRLVETGRVVHLGRTSIHLTAQHRLKPVMRRESECIDRINPAILEASNDFFA